jgi:hypothetical protein
MLNFEQTPNIPTWADKRLHASNPIAKLPPVAQTATNCTLSNSTRADKGVSTSNQNFKKKSMSLMKNSALTQTLPPVAMLPPVLMRSLVV